MKKLVFAIVFLSFVAAGYSMHKFFNDFHRARNSDSFKPDLIISASSSFMGPFGPGPDLAKEFSKICLCNVKYVDSGGGTILLQKLKMGQTIDVVLGLDQIQLKEAAQKIKWKDLKGAKRDWSEVYLENRYKTFIPYNWAPVSLVFKDKKIEQADSLVNLINELPEKSLSIQDPRQSSLGLQLVYWVYLEAGQDLGKFTKLAKLIGSKTKKVSPDWSASYGLFKRGLADYVLSYMTSPLYHIKEEGDHSYGSTLVTEGHPIHIEYAAVPKINCRSCALGKRFVEFMSSDFAQKLLYEKNYMYPVVDSIAEVPKVKKLNVAPMDSFVDQRDEILNRWTESIH